MITAIQYPSFQPAMREITAISQDQLGIVTTSFDHNYHDGLIVRLDIPPKFGMQQANGLTGEVVRIDGTHFAINIDTTNFDPFIIPIGALQVAQVVPVGENTLQVWQATRDVLPNNILP